MENEHTIIDLWVSNFLDRDGFYNSDDIKVIADSIKSIAALVLAGKLSQRNTKEVKKNLQVLTRHEGNGDVHLKINYLFEDGLQMEIDYDEFAAEVKERIKSLMNDAADCAENIKKSGNKKVKISVSGRLKSENTIESDSESGDIIVGSPHKEVLIKHALDFLSNMPDKAAISGSSSKKESPIAISINQRIRFATKEGHKHALHDMNFKGKIEGANDKENIVMVRIKDSFGSENRVSLKTKSVADFKIARLYYCQEKEVLINIAFVRENIFYIESIKPLFTEMDI